MSQWQPWETWLDWQKRLFYEQQQAERQAEQQAQYDLQRAEAQRSQNGSLLTQIVRAETSNHINRLRNNMNVQEALQRPAQQPIGSVTQAHKRTLGGY